MKKSWLLLTSLFFSSLTWAVDEVLIPRPELVQYLPAAAQGLGPVCTDRQAWANPAVVRRLDAVIRRADQLLPADFPAWDEETYLIYSRTGERGRGEQMMNARSAWLYPLVLAECVRQDGRYLERLDQVLNALVDQPTWTWPAHDAKLTSLRGTAYFVDLMAADLGHELAETLFLLGPRLRVETRERVRLALETRLFAPMRQSFATGKNHWWLTADHNWNAVCLKGVVGAALTILPDVDDRAHFAAAATQYIRHFVGGFTGDGYTTEGPDYWNYGYGHFVELRELLWQTSSGRLDVFSEPKVRNMALYGTRIQMLPGSVAPFADASPKTQIDDFAIAYSNQALMLGLPQQLATTEIRAKPPANSAPINRAVITLFGQAATVATRSSSQDDPLRSYFSDVGVLVARPLPGGDSRLAVTIKAGGNGNHSHNDIGSYVLALGKTQLSGDPGKGTYTRETFGPKRYFFRIINSWGHPVPVVDGQLQREAFKVRPQVLATRFTPVRDEIDIDLSKAYHVEKLQKLTRTLVYERTGKGGVTVRDRFVYSQDGQFETAVITRGEWQLFAPDTVLLSVGAERLKAIVTASAPFELIPEKSTDDPNVFTRIGIRLKNEAQQGEIVVHFELN